jgi:hypothetical protein
MIVFTGDWVKISGMWKQVVKLDNARTIHQELLYGRDQFAVLDSDGEFQWWGIEMPQVFDDHISNTEMQMKLAEAGL